MNARAYYQSVQAAIAASPFVIASDIQFNEIDRAECYIRGKLTLINNLELHIAEYIVTSPAMQRLKYRYHLQKNDGTLVSRWDNVPHHRTVSTFPDHRHDSDETVQPSPPMDVFQTLQAIIPFLSKSDGR